METIQQILSALTALVMALSAQIASLPPNSQLAAVAPTSGLVGHWNFNEGSGTTANDTSGNGNTGTLMNNPTWTTGQVGSGALSFGGNNDYVTKASLSGDFTNGGTVSFWAYNNSATDLDGFLTTNQQLPSIFVGNGSASGKIRVMVYNSSGSSAFDAVGSAIPLGQWVFYAITWDSSTLRIYKNGSTIDGQDTTVNGTPRTSAGNLFVGNNGGSTGRSIDGKMDEMRIYNRTLSASEISDIYNDTGSGGGGTPPPVEDTDAPLAPTNIIASAISSNQVNLSWNASTDNVGVTGYRIYRNGTQVDTSATNGYSDTGLSPSSQYSYSVAAYDAAGNASSHDSTITVSTPAAPVSTPTISSFSSSPSSITSGQSSTLSWSVADATSLSISGIGAVTGTSVSVSPTQTTTYTLIATNSQGSATSNTTITVSSGTPPPSGSQTYYIDFASGSDSNNGTSKATPWKRAPGMNGFAGTYTHNAGDVFIFKGGMTWDSTIFNWNISNGGMAGNADYYGVDQTWYSGGSWSQPVFDGGGIVAISGNNTGNIYINGASYITIDNLKIQNLGQPYIYNGGRAFYFNNTHNITIQNSTISPNARVGILINDSVANTTLSNFIVRNNDISAVSWGVGMAPSANNAAMSNVIIANNAIHDFTTQMCGGAHGDGIILYRGGSATGNYIADAHIYGNRFYGDFHTNATVDSCVNNNTPPSGVCSATNPCGMNAFVFLSDPKNGLFNIYNNVMTPTYALGWNGSTAGQMTALLNFQGYTPITTNNINVYNNSAQVTTDVGHGLNITNITSTIFRNNIMSGGPFPIMSNDTTACNGFNADYNIYHNFGNTIAAFPSGCGGFQNWTAYHTTNGKEPHSLNTNPLFISSANLGLQSNSPALNGATNLYSAFTSDITGNSRPVSGSWDIGAYQYSSSGGSTPLPETPPVTLPSISNLVGSNITSNSTQISWNTNIATNGQVFYGTTASYGLQSSLVDNTTKTTSHSLTLSNLSPSTLYHFRVISIDANNNSTSSPDFIFTTSAPASTGGGTTGGSTGGGSTGGSSSSGGGTTVYIPAITTPTSTGGASTTTCVQIQTQKLTRNLYKSLKGEDVKILQNFLIFQNIISSDSNTGFFGPLTEKAVQAFQKSQNIVSSGNFWSTGYGMVGPTTRAKINSMLTSTSCSSRTQTTQSLQEQIKILQAQVNALLLKLQKAQ